MASYILYTYQFAPIINDGANLFQPMPEVEQRMESKQTYLQEILLNANFKFNSKREGVFEHQLRYNSNGIIILKLANNKQLSLEENFKKKKHHYSPSCFVIIDNRQDVQHIAIEDDPTAFSTTDVVRNIMEYSLKKALKTYGLTISIKKEYQKTEFWQLLEQYPKGVSMVRFHFSYPNLPRVSESINALISNQSKITNSKSTTFELKSSDSEQLSLSNDNEELNGLVNASADSGNVITLKVKGLRRYVKTGETTKKIEIDDLEVQMQSDNLFQNRFEKIVELLNAAK
ncbi:MULTISPECIES: hypothetical protein [Bacteroidales]|jgi:uncharacterized Zn ribbon protein|uniref:DUF4747 family protein n=1 Tax=Candidatus Caccoplasma intestinavium TaxID=2840716 RepID=A0A9D1KCT9_9BACT|nr:MULTISPECIES: hypothetical protein [Bacteroidales]MBM6902161.1 hypothetical protein [Phocaeicola coprocola]HIT38934.1 hypothetical protein [Candidatus Caccoplasma intestinavium]